MPWKECDSVSLRYEFVRLAAAEGANMSRLCRRFGVSRKTGYKWLKRYRTEGKCGLRDRSRRPHRSPNKTPVEMDAMIMALREKHPEWGGRKLRRWLIDRGVADVPSPGTITRILGVGELLDGEPAERRPAVQRFERPFPNDLWQMDFKGQFRMATGRYCYPLTALDDHSRYNLILHSCGNQKRPTVQSSLESAFRRYGLPNAILCDRGVPWCSRNSGLTRLSLWLLRLGIEVWHGRARHPQTQGKLERFHRTLKAEALSGRQFRDLEHVQSELNAWRKVYNHERPHDALDLDVPSSRYQLPEREYPSVLPAVEYEPGAVLRKVSSGVIHYETRAIYVGKTLDGERVAVRAGEGARVRFCYGGFEIAHADLEQIPRGEYGRARLFASLRSANSLAR